MLSNKRMKTVLFCVLFVTLLGYTACDVFDRYSTQRFQGELIHLKNLQALFEPWIEVTANVRFISFERVNTYGCMCFAEKNEKGKDAFEQLKRRTSGPLSLKRIDTSNTQIADGVLYTVGLEFSRGQRTQLTLLDFEHPYTMWLPDSSSPRSERISPSFPTQTITGPIELYFPRSREIKLKVPNDVDPGMVKKVLINHDTYVNGTGYYEMRLLNSLEVEKLSFFEEVTQAEVDDYEADATSLQVIGDVQLPTPPAIVKHRLRATFSNTPKVMLYGKADKLQKSESLGDMITLASAEKLKVKRGARNNEIVLSRGDTDQVDTHFSIDLQLSDTLHRTIKHVLDEIKPRFPHDEQPLKRIISGSSEVLVIPMQIEDDKDISFWHVLAVRKTTGETEVISHQKLPHSAHPSISDQVLGNTSAPELQSRVASLVTAGGYNTHEEINDGEINADNSLL